jgi:hypothetical protein
VANVLIYPWKITYDACILARELYSDKGENDHNTATKVRYNHKGGED